MSATFRDPYDNNSTFLPMLTALLLHGAMGYWNPTLLSSQNVKPPEMMKVQYRDVMPELPKPEPAKPEVKKPDPPKEEPKPKPKPKPAKKSGISKSEIAKPMTVKKAPAKKMEASNPAPLLKKEPPKKIIAMPKFIPKSADDVLAGGGAASISAPKLDSKPIGAGAGFFKGPKLQTKSRGIVMSDIKFEVGAGSLTGAARGPVIKIPVGEERSDIAVVASAPTLKAKTGKILTGGSPFGTGKGFSGTGELVGKERAGLRPGRIDVGVGGGISDADIMRAAGGTGRGGSGGNGNGISGSGFELGGPVGDRSILRRKLPEYPAWAEEQGISAMVTVFFSVKPDGTVRTNTRVVRSSGYQELDKIAMEAIKQWKFSATSASSSEKDAWGVITFRFTLH